MHIRYLLFASLAGIGLALNAISESFRSAGESLADLVVATFRDDFGYQPTAAESLELDTLAANVENTPTPWRSFLAFVSRALAHDRHTGGGFAHAEGSTA